jgi:hypothetical protein
MAEVATELTKITARHLRRAEEMCRRRLALELDDQRGNRANGARFAVSNRVAADVRLAHTEFGPPDPAAFVVPTELVPEQQRVYQAAVRGYLALFGDRPAGAIDLGFDTEVEPLGVRLVGDVGVALDTGNAFELRVLRLGTRGHDQPLVDDVDLRFATLRAAAWLSSAPELRVVAADLLGLACSELVIDVREAERAAAQEWLAERVAHVRALADRDRPKAGSDCLGCGFVAGCRAHR